MTTLPASHDDPRLPGRGLVVETLVAFFSSALMVAIATGVHRLCGTPYPRWAPA
jgi:hypothetical protein